MIRSLTSDGFGLAIGMMLAATILLIGLIVIFWIKNTKIQRENSYLNKQTIELLRKNDNLTHELSKLTEELNRLAATKDVDTSELNRRLEELNSRIGAKINELNELDSKVGAKIGELGELDSKVNDKINTLERLNGDLTAKENEISGSEAKLIELTNSVDQVNGRLAELSKRYEAALGVIDGEGCRWVIEPEEKNRRLVNLISELVDNYGIAYPVLGRELLKIEWSVVWLPIVQKLCSRENLDRSGIYRLTLKVDDKVCYIGQAKSIKDRWYTHIKKMLGVEAKGSERLYEYRPEEFYWEVVEFKDGDLNEAEKYWIEYFKCKEIGLNKKSGG